MPVHTEYQLQNDGKATFEQIKNRLTLLIPDNNKFYIGYSGNPAATLENHINELKMENMYLLFRIESLTIAKSIEALLIDINKAPRSGNRYVKAVDGYYYIYMMRETKYNSID